ncbi:MAG TPA: plasmid pRiA4b ORF-3 family protein, partial [Burkholderiales bacterium]
WYDFGDDWFHAIKVEKVLEPEAGAVYPRCVEGGRACPPEDCGGVWGYANMLEALADPKHEEHEEYLEWLCGPFDTEAFDLDAVNRELKRRFQRKTTGKKKS